jgi:hypothetical protein
MATAKTEINRLIREDQTVSRPLISWPSGDSPHKVHRSIPRKEMPGRTFFPAKQKKKN